MTDTEASLSVALTAILVVATLTGAIAFTDTAAAAESATITADPATANDSSPHRVGIDVSLNEAGNSLSNIYVNYSVDDAYDGTVAEVDEEDIEKVGIDEDGDGEIDTNVTDLKDIYYHEDAKAIEFDFGGNYGVNVGDRIIIEYNDSINPSEGNYTVAADINTGSSDDPAFASLNVTAGDDETVENPASDLDELIASDPRTPGVKATHWLNISVTSNEAGNSLNGILVNYHEDGSYDGSVQDVDADDIRRVGIDTDGDGRINVGVGDDLEDVSAKNVGETLTLDFGGSYSLEEGDSVILVFEDTDNPNDPGEYDVAVDLNEQSTNDPRIGSITLANFTYENATLEEINETAVTYNNTSVVNATWRNVTLTNDTFENVTVANGTVWNNTTVANATLTNVTWNETVYENVTVTNTTWNATTWENTTVENATWTNATYENATVDNPTWENVTVTNSTWENTTVTNSTWNETTWDNATAENVTVVNSTFENATFVNVTLTNVTIANATWTNTTVTNATASEANITDTAFANVTVEGTNVTETAWTNVTVTDANVSETTWTNTTVEDTNVSDTAWINVTVDHSNVTDTAFENTTVEDANVTDTAFTNATLTATNVSDAAFTNVTVTNSTWEGSNVTHVDWTNTTFAATINDSVVTNMTMEGTTWNATSGLWNTSWEEGEFRNTTFADVSFTNSTGLDASFVNVSETSVGHKNVTLETLTVEDETLETAMLEDHKYKSEEKYVRHVLDGDENPDS